ncbi:hypothetical protein ACFSL6_00250 [Paenibacillus thailandensis]|uniref:hypothetical protein n=1 Tax=Paenibacillus thailandensis TaxID=393250 RepID=UPI00362B4C25
MDRETVEEAGLILEAKRVPFAAWYWESTDTYTVFVIAKVKHLGGHAGRIRDDWQSHHEP